MGEYPIRVCRPDDLPAVRALLLQLVEVAEPAYDLQIDVMAGMFREMAALPDLYQNWVAEAGGEVAGFVSVVFYKTLFHRVGTALINELVVSRDLRGRGIGQALIRTVIDEARARGMDEVEVGTEQSNAAARRFYQRRGFELAGLRRGAINETRRRKPGIPRVAANGIPIRDEIELAMRL